MNIAEITTVAIGSAKTSLNRSQNGSSIALMSHQYTPNWTEPLLSWRSVSGSRLAVIDQNESITYGELRVKVSSLAGTLRQNLRPCNPSVIAIAIPLGLDFTIALLASLETGAVVVPIDAGLPVERIREILRDARPNLVITSEGTLPNAISSDSDRKTLLLSELIKAIPSRPANLSQSNWKGVLLYTSGTTGDPKGVLVSGQMLIREASTLIDRLGIVAEDRISHMLSPSVIGGLREILSALLSGGVLLPFRIKEIGLSSLIEQMELQKVTVCRLVSTMFRSICHALPRNPSLAIRRLYIGGECLTGTDIDLFRKHFKEPCQLSNVFGATEFGLCTHYTISADVDLPSWANVPIGTANSGYELSVIDQEGNEVAQGEPGCLVVAGECIAEGYWNSQKGSVEPFEHAPSRVGWRRFKTSDIVRLNDAGQFEYLGRSDHQVKINGNRIELVGVENTLRRANGVQDAVVICMEIDGRTSLAAMVQRQSDENQDLIGWCKEHLPESSIPQFILERNEIPRSLQGKCDRKAVERKLQDFVRQRPGVSGESSRAEVLPKQRAEVIDKLWRQANHLHADGTIEDLSVFHADSLSKLEFLINIRNQLGLEIKPSELSPGMTFQQFRKIVQGRLQSAETNKKNSCLRLTEPHPGPILFLIHGASGETGNYKFLVDAWEPAISLFGVNADRQALCSRKPVDFSLIVESTIQSIQCQSPNGPYLLAGFSFGGVLAYEVAAEMTKRGQVVAYCGMIDSFLPIQLRYPRSLSRYFGIPYNLPRWIIDTISTKAMRKTWKRFHAQTTTPYQRLGGLHGSPDAQKELATILLQACDQLKPTRSSLQTYFYRAKVRPLLHSHRVESDWMHHTGAQLHVRTLSGNHWTVMKPGYIHALSDAMALDIQSALSRI